MNTLARMRVGHTILDTGATLKFGRKNKQQQTPFYFFIFF